MRVLVADEFSTRHLGALSGLGLEVDYRPKLGAAGLVEAAKDASVLVVRSTEVARALFEAATRLSLVVRAGAGVNTIDVAAASERGVFVANCPGQNAIAVAELALGLMLAADRKLPDCVAAARAGVWDKARFSKARGLYGRTLGIVGLGAVGTALAARARALGMKVAVVSRSLTQAKAEALGVTPAESLVALACQADFFSVHVPGGAATKGFISVEVLAALRPGSVFVNTSRADVVDGAAVLAEARSGRLFVATDVFDGEPKGGAAEWKGELAQLPAVYGTPHIGASTEQAQEAIADEAVRIVERFLVRGEVPNCVNVARRTPARFQLIVRHLDRVGVLANVLACLGEAGINAQEIDNTVFEGAAAACCKIQVDSRPSDEVLGKIRGRADEIIFVDLVELPA